MKTFDCVIFKLLKKKNLKNVLVFFVEFTFREKSGHIF